VTLSGLEIRVSSFDFGLFKSLSIHRQETQFENLAVGKVEPVPAQYQKAFKFKSQSINIRFVRRGDRLLLPHSETVTLHLISGLCAFLRSGDWVHLPDSETVTLPLISGLSAFLRSGDRVHLPDSETVTLPLISGLSAFLRSGDRIHLPDSETTNIDDKTEC
jgi:hypothetical protein